MRATPPLLTLLHDALHTTSTLTLALGTPYPGGIASIAQVTP